MLLVVLKFIGDVEAGALMESIDGACCSEPTTSPPTTRMAVWPVALGEFLPWNDRQCRRASGMLDDGETTGADVLERSLGVGSRLLGASVRGTCSWPVLPVDESCAPDRAAYASAHICWAGSDRSRARTRDVCVMCERCTACCLGHQKRHCSGAFRSHDMISGLSEALCTLVTSLPRL